MVLPELIMYGIDHALDRTDQYNQAKALQEQSAAIEEQWNNYLNKMRSMYAPELAGEIRPGERKAVDRSVARKKAVTAEEAQEATNRMLQNMYRAGIRGGDLAGENLADIETSKEEIIANYQQDLENQLLHRASQRQTGAKDMMAQGERAKNQAVAPYEMQYDQAVEGLRANTIDPMNMAKGALAGWAGGTMLDMLPFDWAQGLGAEGAKLGAQLGDPVMAKYAAQPLAAYMMGNIGNMMGGDYNPEMMQRQQAVRQTLQGTGVDPSMFAQADEQLPSQVGNTIYTPKTEYDALGNKRTIYDKSPVGSQDKGLTPYQKESLKRKDEKVTRKEAEDYVDKHEWETAADKQRYKAAVEHALKTGAPIPDPTGGRNLWNPLTWGDDDKEFNLKAVGKTKDGKIVLSDGRTVTQAEAKKIIEGQK